MWLEELFFCAHYGGKMSDGDWGVREIHTGKIKPEKDVG